MNEVRPVSRSALRERFNLLPGILLLGVVGYAGKLTEQSIAAYGKAHQLTLPNIEYVLWAIGFGLIVSNTVGVPAIFRAGVATYEFWLKAGIVLLGVRFLLGELSGVPDQPEQDDAGHQARRLPKRRNQRSAPTMKMRRTRLRPVWRSAR